jgi:dethiobiotin synthetase
MTRKPPRGLFVTGVDTGVGKTYVTALVARALLAEGHRVGVYKPAASGCTLESGRLVSSDAVALWHAAGAPGTLDEVCPQKFAAPLAPHLAAQAEGKQLDSQLLRSGLEPWIDRSDIVLVEGAGGLMSPLGEEEFVADLALDLGFPLLVVARNVLGVINHVMQTLIVAATFRDGLDVAGILLNQSDASADSSVAGNADEIRRRAVSPLLAELGYGADFFQPGIDWFALAGTARRRSDRPEGALRS